MKTLNCPYCSTSVMTTHYEPYFNKIDCGLDGIPGVLTEIYPFLVYARKVIGMPG